MIYIDSCIPMYIVGSAHPNKNRVLEKLPQLINGKTELFTSVESFQEIIHRYRSINNPEHLGRAYEALEELVEAVSDVTKADVDRARLLVAEHPKLSSRDCLHVAIMRRHGCKTVWTFDRGFEFVGDIERIE